MVQDFRQASSGTKILFIMLPHVYGKIKIQNAAIKNTEFGK